MGSFEGLSVHVIRGECLVLGIFKFSETGDNVLSYYLSRGELQTLHFLIMFHYFFVFVGDMLFQRKLLPARVLLISSLRLGEDLIIIDWSFLFLESLTLCGSLCPQI